jgi:chromosome segregation ATPase
MDNLNVRDDAWQRLSDTQRGVLERAASYERVLGELEQRTRVLEKENGDLQRQAKQFEKRAAGALESERGALAEVESLKRDVERRDMQVATANKAIADAHEATKSAREAESEARSTATRLQSRIRELEMASKMQRFLADHERRAGSGAGDLSTASDTAGAVPGASPIPASKDQEDAQSASMLREAIQMCTTTTPARAAAPAEHSEASAAGRGTPLSLGELVAPTKGGGQPARALGGSGRVNEVASALSAVAQEVRTFAVRQNEISVARKAAEREAADSENVANLAELRELLMQRATALRQQELGLIEYQTRFKAFEAAVGERLKLLARQERDARFHATIAVESRHDLLRLSDALINQRRKTRRHLQAAEAQLMEKADRSMTCSESQYEAGPTLSSALAAGIKASPARIRAPIRRADTWIRSTVSEYRAPFVCGLVFLILVGSIIWFLLTDSEAQEL